MLNFLSWKTVEVVNALKGYRHFFNKLILLVISLGEVLDVILQPLNMPLHCVQAGFQDLGRYCKRKIQQWVCLFLLQKTTTTKNNGLWVFCLVCGHRKNFNLIQDNKLLFIYLQMTQVYECMPNCTEQQSTVGLYYVILFIL